MSERVRGKMGISMSKFGLGLGLKFNSSFKNWIVMYIQGCG